jgi:tetratricopeptide (TPR) repeat protein
MRTLLALTIALATLASTVAAQTPADRERARAQNRLGWEQMTSESWESAARYFQSAIDIDPAFEIPHYGLGRANMALKKFPAAVAAYARCRDLYRAQAGKIFTNQQEAQRYRRDRLTEIDEQIRQIQSGPQTVARIDLLRQWQDTRRDVQERLQRGGDTTLEANVPAWLSLALGSAYFRSGQLSDAEREYKAAIAADTRAGEAHSNLAVVYLETGRITEADAAIRAAKKAGFKVNPQLEQAIKDRK